MHSRPTTILIRRRLLLAALAFALLGSFVEPQQHPTSSPDGTSSDAATASALCPIVYPLDDYATDHGYRFNFFGNGFFVNRDGYLITAAHVLQTFRDGGQPSILVQRPDAPSQLLRAQIIAVDWAHDVAILKASPNPFQGRYRVSFLSLTPNPPAIGQSVIALALHPPNPRHAGTYQASIEDRSPGEVLDYQFTQEEKSSPDTEMLLFGHEVQHGQSGSPVLSATTREVVGIVDGRWLRTFGIPHSASPEQPFVPGAAVPIHYALTLLQERGISWQSSKPASVELTSQSHSENDGVPVPLSLVASPFPENGLVGGKVVLDVTLDATGCPADIALIDGGPQFAQKAVEAVRTWSFKLPPSGLNSPKPHVGIVFEFIASAATASHASSLRDNSRYRADHASIPQVSALPPVQLGTAHGGVIFVSTIDANGQPVSPAIWSGSAPLSSPVAESFKTWRFTPALQSGKPVPSTFVLVAVFRGS
jgi:hypothetical protein